MYTTEQLAGMNKLKLRSACREHKVKGYSKMNNEGMRAALADAATGVALKEAWEAEGVDETFTTQPHGPQPVASGPLKIGTKPKAPKAKVVNTAVSKSKEKDREERNGIKRPSAGGACAAVWDWLDSHRDATIADVKAIAAKKGWNENNAGIELYQWRKFNGIASKGKRS